MRAVIVVLVAGVLATGCATGLNSYQQTELRTYEARGLKVEEKSETTAAWLGLLPGGGSFYTGHVGLGIVNLLFWPLSMTWDPVSGYDGAQVINYAATKAHVRRLENREIEDLDTELAAGRIDAATYALQKREIERKYDVED